jgi:hypothetical protein
MNALTERDDKAEREPAFSGWLLEKCTKILSAGKREGYLKAVRIDVMQSISPNASG